MQQIVEKIVRFLEKKGAAPVADHQVYVYGVDAALYTIISTAGLILIGSLLGRVLETILIIAVFYTNQTIGGGFHASTHMRCFIVMSFGLVIALALLNCQPSYIGIGAIAAGAGTLLLAFPLKLHRNKAYLASKSAEQRRRSRVVVCIELFVFVALGYLGTANILYAYALGMAVSAVSRLIVILPKLRKNTERNL